MKPVAGAGCSQVLNDQGSADGRQRHMVPDLSAEVPLNSGTFGEIGFATSSWGCGGLRAFCIPTGAPTGLVAPLGFRAIHPVGANTGLD
jgi:hypothetical protein